MKRIIEKLLSSNDVGATGAHQAGILIPKKEELLSFFPVLDRIAENPRVTIQFSDTLDQIWKFNFIYYNNKLRGGTRNEYRLTGMTRFFRENGLVTGDILVFENNDGDYSIRIKRKADPADPIEDDDGTICLVLDDTWKIIHY